MIAAIATLGGMAFILAVGLGIASRIFAVETDPKITTITGLLPGANCGGCGYAGCSGFATALVAGEAAPLECKASGADAIQEISKVLGVVYVPKEKTIARVFCQGSLDKAKVRYRYQGIEDCNAAMLLGGGAKACVYGCLGMGSCVKACPFGAISMGPEGLPRIDESSCTGCGACARKCPKGVIELIPARQMWYISCNSHHKGKAVRQVCEVGCIACGLCVRNCPEQAITLDNNRAVIDPEKCSGCGICAEKCPQKVIHSRSEDREVVALSKG
ncbi:MAG: RnfABCDGE type electron transport complex subunit B [bacterium]